MTVDISVEISEQRTKNKEQPNIETNVNASDTAFEETCVSPQIKRNLVYTDFSSFALVPVLLPFVVAASHVHPREFVPILVCVYVILFCRYYYITLPCTCAFLL